MGTDLTGAVNFHPKPSWLIKRLPNGPSYEATRRILQTARLHTVCQEARCPNLWECFSRRTATFLILGNRCTRNCRFCAIQHASPQPIDPEEPERIAETVCQLDLEYVVITSVTRDDLPDGGANHFARTIKEIRKRAPGANVEVLIPDFQGKRDALMTVLEAAPDVLNHNIETVPRLYPRVRPGADYQRSRTLLSEAAQLAPEIPTKSGMMLGLGETPDEVLDTLRDLSRTGCSIVTLGQYLQPSKRHLPVARYVPPEEFESLRETALKMGFSQVFSGPLVRSSYRAKEIYQAVSLSLSTPFPHPSMEVPDA